MIQTQEYVVKLTQGQSTSTKELGVADPEHTYSFHSMIILGSRTDDVDVVLNGNTLRLSAGFVYNQTSIRSVNVTTSAHGVLLIGKKTKKTLFN
jgi:hypothetical protein